MYPYTFIALICGYVLFQFPRPPVQEKERVKYFNLEDLRKDIHKEVKLPWCVTLNDAEAVKVAVVENGILQMEATIISADETVSPTHLLVKVSVRGIPAPHLQTDLKDKKLQKFLQELYGMCFCDGVTNTELQDLATFPDGDSSKPYFRQIINFVGMSGEPSSSSCVRSRSCELLLHHISTTMCKCCRDTEKALLARQERRNSKSVDLIKMNDPLHGLTQGQATEAFKQARQDNTRLQKEVNSFKAQLQTDCIAVKENLHKDLMDIDSSQIEDPLTKLFWEEQVKAFSTKGRGMRWHPMMVRLAILLHSQSRAAYDTLRTTGVLHLPGESTLREYTNVITPHEGFHAHVQEELEKKAMGLEKSQRYVCLLHDEMTIKSDLVFDRVTGELIGFVNKDRWSFTRPRDKLATHALVFYIVGINSNVKMSLGYFGTRSASADQLYPLFWQAVEFVEEAGFQVIVSTSDKAPANQRLYQMHSDNKTDICYKTKNLVAPDRHIYFISDPPHLIKTIRNNLASSGSGRNTKLLWNNGKHLLWRHITELYQKDLENGLQLLPRLTRDHVYLNAHSVMNVRLAAQVLSFRVGSVMSDYGPDGSEETATLILLVDRFFDCLNTRNLEEGQRCRKPDLLPYRDANDVRFHFLQHTFLKYISDWKTSVDARPGFRKAEKQKMFLTPQTYKGLVMTIHAFVEATKFLLANGVSFVLSNKFCQDPLEEHFGRHRAMGRTNDNPNLHQLGYQENCLRLQRDLSIMFKPKGNVRGAKRESVPCAFSTSPLKKKQKH